MLQLVQLVQVFGNRAAVSAVQCNCVVAVLQLVQLVQVCGNRAAVSAVQCNCVVALLQLVQSRAGLW